eukprot:4886076-Heterocapsa_arctica.AAC.1
MKSIVAAASHASEDSLGVKETGPIARLPPAQQEEAKQEVNYDPPGSEDIADMQTGVRKEEPAASTKRWRRNWSNECSDKAVIE